MARFQNSWKLDKKGIFRFKVQKRSDFQIFTKNNNKKLPTLLFIRGSRHQPNSISSAAPRIGRVLKDFFVHKKYYLRS